MACATPVLVSSTSYIEWTPCGTPADKTVVRLDITADSSAAITGTFRLWVNGVYTAAITYNATLATLATNIQTALDAVLLTPTTYTAAASVAEPTKVEITADQVGYNNIKAIVEDLQGQKTLNATINVRYIDTGTQTFVLTPDLMNYSTNESVTFEDVTPLSQKATRQVVVGEDMSFDVSMYDKSGQLYAYGLHAGAAGVLSIFKEGKVLGSEFTSFHALIESSDLDAPNKGKLEKSFSGVRQDDYIFAPGSVYAP